RALHASALYKNDENKAIRKSHENPSIKKLYEEYLGKPGSHKAHETLHTTYVKRSVY
ncbi:MAG: iron hydrogenase small subunit, partial [Oscillospiraceae bacterium]